MTRRCGKQLEMLEHHADPGTHLGQVGLGIGQTGAVEHDVTGLNWLQCVDTLDERRLSAARGTAHHHDVALGDVCGARLQGLHGPVPFVDGFDVDHRVHGVRFQRMMAVRDCSRRTSCDSANEIKK